MERPIATEVVAQVSLPRVQAIIDRDPGIAFGSVVGSGPSCRFRTTITVEGPGGVSMSHPIEIEARTSRSEDTGSTLEFAWSPSGGGEALLPTFSGRLELVPAGPPATTFRLDGDYQIPLGALGRFGDGVIGHRIARQSVRGLLEAIVGRIERESLDHSRRAPTIPAPHAPDLRRSPRSESPIG
ncbi:hypothetical protein [Actinospongicola halichondriae]|uniref:hypothetical protein n=1 Tax=Actinospongicola halichondriae TaxID=3236844 RepID=UPI003D4E42F0